VPIATIAEARDEILTYFTTAWNTLGTPPLLLYDDKHTDLPDNAPYARINVQHDTFGQNTLGGKVSAGGGGRRFGRTGLVTVQIFTPSGDGLTSMDTLVDFAMDTLEGEETGSDRVEFRDARANEVGQDGPWHQTNVIAEFQYDRVK
jgi:hypothetical protein